MHSRWNIWIVAALAWAAGGCEAMPADIAVPENYRRVSVADFGAIPDDGKDDSAAVSKALAAAAERPGSVLVLPKGRYDFAHDRRPGRNIYHFPVHGARGLVIDGQGSKLIFRGKTAPFSFTDCQDVAVMNLTIDWEEPIYSAGIITKSAPRSFEVALDAEYTGEGKERIENVIEWDPRTHLPLAGGAAIGDLPEAPHKNIQPPRKIGPKTLRVDLNVDRKMSEGAYVVLVHQNYVYNAFSVNESQGVRFQDVTIHYTPGMACFCRRATDLLF
ncbi:MAG TPA: glycosyl hydrolase family 28-related protein, partial [Phycisphaerae bacterium]|nr:glycosyl hydrolase family 28-related protein [Phycisphaerae bacterium]